MENQPTEQSTVQPMEQATAQSVEHESSSKIWYAVLVVVVIGLGLLYFVMKSPVADEATTGSQTVVPALTEGNTTADISADLNQVLDSSANLEADATAVVNELQSL